MMSPSPRLMGVVNVTPDSFSDGGKYLVAESAIEHSRRLFAEGAQVLDIGGESTRPGAERVHVDEEIARVVPVIRGIASSDWFLEARRQGNEPAITIDTMNAETAIRAVEAGATIVNDVSGGLADPKMFGAIVETAASVILGHWRGFSASMDDLAKYTEVAAEVSAELSARVSAAEKAGIARSRILIDPGLGFSKDASQNWQLLNNLGELKRLGLPLVIGASRKRFLAAVLPEPPTDISPEAAAARRDAATAHLTALLSASQHSSDIAMIRVHNVAANKDALAVAQAFIDGRVAAQPLG